MRGQDFTGRRFGRLTAIKIVGHNKHAARLWLWRCDCGEEIERPSQAIKEGRQISCGCYRPPRATHGKSSTTTYRAWIEMKARCRGKDQRSITYYRDRNIAVCARWEKFEPFFADMGERPPGFTIERIDNERGYYPGNCRWAPQREQLRNTRRTLRVIIDGVEMCLKDACALLGVNYAAARSRMRQRGATAQQALHKLPDGRIGNKNRLGHKFSEESKRKISEGVRRYYTTS
jgi:hypothetical protein